MASANATSVSCVCVVGMHRSGTSCLAGILQLLGVELGQVYTKNLHNKRGNRENSRIVSLNDELLHANQAAWNRPRVVEQWDPQQAAERDDIISTLRGRAVAHWGFKDPRTLFTLPFWLEGMQLPQFIGTYRHPQRVALSLQRRDGSSLAEGWKLWLAYNHRLLALAERYEFPLTDFDQDDTAYLDDALSKLLSLGLDATKTGQARQFFDPALRSQSRIEVSSTKLPDAVQAVYARLRAYDQAYT